MSLSLVFVPYCPPASVAHPCPHASRSARSSVQYFERMPSSAGRSSAVCRGASRFCGHLGRDIIDHEDAHSTSIIPER